MILRGLCVCQCVDIFRDSFLIHLLPPGGSGTLHPPPWGLGLWRGGAGGSGGRAGGGLALGLRDLDGELGRDDCFRGQSWPRLGEFLSLTVHADLEREDGEIQRRCRRYRDIFSSTHAHTQTRERAHPALLSVSPPTNALASGVALIVSVRQIKTDSCTKICKYQLLHFHEYLRRLVTPSREKKKSPNKFAP